MFKKFFAVAAASLMLVLGANAADTQPMPDPQMPDASEMAKMQADQMKEVCSIDAEQYEKVLKVFTETSKKMQDVMAGGDFDQEKMGKIMNEQNESLKKILTEDQYKKWEKHMQEMMANFGGGF